MYDDKMHDDASATENNEDNDKAKYLPRILTKR